MRPEEYELLEWQSRQEEQLEADKPESLAELEESKSPEWLLDLEEIEGVGLGLAALEHLPEASFISELEEAASKSWQEEIAEEIVKAPNPFLREELIEDLKRVSEMEAENNRKSDAGEISPLRAELDDFHEVGSAKKRLRTKAGLASVNLDFAQLGELSDSADDLKVGNLANMEAKDEVGRLVAEAGPERAEAVAWEKFRNGELDEDGRDLILRKARLQSLKDAEK